MTKSKKKIMAKGEIAHHEQFLISPQCFQKSSALEASESVCMRKRVNTEMFSNGTHLKH